MNVRTDRKRIHNWKTKEDIRERVCYAGYKSWQTLAATSMPHSNGSTAPARKKGGKERERTKDAAYHTYYTTVTISREDEYEDKDEEQKVNCHPIPCYRPTTCCEIARHTAQGRPFPFPLIWIFEDVHASDKLSGGYELWTDQRLNVSATKAKLSCQTPNRKGEAIWIPPFIGREPPPVMLIA